MDSIKTVNKSTKEPRFSSLSKKQIGGYTSLFAILVIGAVLFTLRSHSSEQLNNLKSVEGRISKHMLLPTDEPPALLTVIDKNKLTSPFLKMKAENGDKILIYKIHKRAIIYRPRIDRIVDISVVNIDTPPTPKRIE
jgi:hypothetical protein